MNTRQIYWNKRAETLSRDALAAVQLAGLQKTVRHVWENNAFYRTRDLTRILSRDTCACGRTGVRIERIHGRCDDMLIIKGVNFFPKQVEQALMEIPGVLPEYQIIIEENHGVCDVRVNVEAREGVTGFMVEKALKERLGFSPKGDIFKPGTLPRTEGKAKRVIRTRIA